MRIDSGFYSKKRCVLLIHVVFFTLCSFSQSEGKPPVDYSENHIIYSDVGFYSAPARIKYPFLGTINRVLLRNNFNPFIGLGYAHKWFNLRLNFPLKNAERAVSRYGKTRAFNFALDFQVKKYYFEMGLNFYRGFAVKNAYLFSDSLNELRPNLIYPNMTSVNFYLSTYIFENKNLKMKGLKGKTAFYKSNLQSLYFNPNFSIFGLSNGDKEILPQELRDSSESITLNQGISTIELSLLPGFAKIHTFKAFMLGGFIGIGPAIQAKSYALSELSRSFLGLALRSDWRLVFSYNQPKYFFISEVDFNNKSIRFINFRFRQTYYGFRFTAGYRFESKPEKGSKL